VRRLRENRREKRLAKVQTFLKSQWKYFIFYSLGDKVVLEVMELDEKSRRLQQTWDKCHLKAWKETLNWFAKMSTLLRVQRNTDIQNIS
jgi:hypothetical protein